MEIAKCFLLSGMILSLNFVTILPKEAEVAQIADISKTEKQGEIKESELDFDFKGLIEQAKKAREKSYSPYSNFKVGAAVLTKDGKIYTGTNVENASYGLSVCAERTTIFKAVSEGEKGNFIKAIAIILDAPDYGAPCGACRQIINEFAEPEAYVVMATMSGNYKIVQLKTLLPYAFKLEQDNK